VGIDLEGFGRAPAGEGLGRGGGQPSVRTKQLKPMRNKWRLYLAVSASGRACSSSSERLFTVAWGMGRMLAALSKNSGMRWRRVPRQGKRSSRR